MVVNGELVDQISVSDRGLMYGDGLFETMRYVSFSSRAQGCTEHCVPLLLLHLSRLTRDAHRLGIDIDKDELRSSLDLLCRTAEQKSIHWGKIKILVTRGLGGAGNYLPVEAKPTIIVSLLAFSADPLNSDPSLSYDLRVAKSCLPSASVLAGIKHLNRLPYTMGIKGLALQEGEQALFLDERSNVVESIHHNVYFVKEACVFSPSLTQCGVAGVMQRFIAETVCPGLGLDYQQRDIPLAEIANYDEAFVSNALSGIVPVRNIKCVPFSGDVSYLKSETCGEIQTQLQQRLTVEISD